CSPPPTTGTCGTRSAALARFANAERTTRDRSSVVAERFMEDLPGAVRRTPKLMARWFGTRGSLAVSQTRWGDLHECHPPRAIRPRGRGYGSFFARARTFDRESRSCPPRLDGARPGP